ncbi:oxidoreductase [Actinomadura litoris]|uniref:SDR family NAD(P)-dependent oxidoreductase n=1 Tax=Actinomadura litoris TaxID=2678616 RepID=A0A7K1L039_9ACTN|nr:oxidoreductase [Actinomadura litoris]MUN37801.1 SDR family NAD(P)-dependent oxidoreductase [Actinomadura litoris]
MANKVALVTGASSGIGEAAAYRLHRKGFTVFGAARRTDRMERLAASGVRTLSLDVTSETSAERAVAEIVAAEGRVDVLVNNAGYGSYGALEDVPPDEARAQLDVNLFGLARMTRLVLPHMRARRAGTIVNVSSVGGRLATPLGAWYHASKYAVEGLSDALRLEAARFGIDVVVIEPASIRSEWGAIAAGRLRATSGRGAYAEQAEAMARILERSSRPGGVISSPPAVVGDAIAEAATARRPKTRYRVGRGSGSMIMTRRLLRDRAYDALMKRGVRLPG